MVGSTILIIEITESDGRSIFTIKSANYGYVKNKSDFTGENESKRRTVVKNFNWNALYDCCELFRIALNLCCVDGGRKKVYGNTSFSTEQGTLFVF